MSEHACGLRRSSQRLGYCFGWCLEAEGVSRPAVEFGGDAVEVVLAIVPHAHGRGPYGASQVTRQARELLMDMSACGPVPAADPEPDAKFTAAFDNARSGCVRRTWIL